MPSTLRFPLLLTLALAACAALMPASAGAAQTAQAAGRIQSFQPVSNKPRTLVFRLQGLRASDIESAYVRFGARSQRLSVRRVRVAARRGVLKLRASRRQAAKSGRLFVRTAAARDSYAVPADAYHVSPAGSDSAPGTAGRPWRTLDHAAGVAGPGDTVAVHAGTYSQPGVITRLSRNGTTGAPITFVGMPGEALPRVLGQLRIEGDYVEVLRFLIDGPTGRVAAATSDNRAGEDVEVWIRGSHTMLADSEVRDGHWHAGVYVSDGAKDVDLLRNHIHDNGNFGDRTQANLDHGIYWDAGSGRIAGNLVEHNLSYGVHLYPDAAGVTIEGNTIRDHGRDGVLVADRSSGNLVRGNLITRNRIGVRSYELTGSHNVVSDNEVVNNREGDLIDTDGLTLHGNVTG